MPYGSRHPETNEQILRYAKMFGVEVNLEPDEKDELTLSVIYGGALDEEFPIGYLNAPFIGHVMAGTCVAEASNLDYTDEWSVMISDPDTGDCLWRRDSRDREIGEIE